MSRVPQTGEFLRMSPESTRVPSTHLQRTLPEAPECDACPETPGKPRMHPDAPRVRSRETPPGTFRVRRTPRAPHRETTPGHSASTPRVPGSVFFSTEF